MNEIPDRVAEGMEGQAVSHHLKTQQRLYNYESINYDSKSSNNIIVETNLIGSEERQNGWKMKE